MPFQPGNQLAKGHGRPPKAREAALLAIAAEILNAQTWRQVVTKRVLDALGKIQGIDAKGQPALIDDSESTAQGRNQAAIWLRDTVIGKPTEYIDLGPSETPYDLFSGYSDEQLEQIRELLRKLQSDSSDGISDRPGIGIPPTDKNQSGQSV